MALDTNLVSYWKLDESSGNAADSVGSTTLTNTGVTYAAGKINNAAVLGSSGNNGNNLLNTSVGAGGLNLSAGVAKSISWWFKPNANPSTDTNRFIDWRENTGTSGELTLSYQNISSDYVFYFYVNGGAMSNYTANLTVGTWYYLTLTCDSSNAVKFYIDASEVTTGTWGSTGTSGNFTQIGNANGNSTGTFGGPFSIDEFGAWQKELTPSEITSLYNSGTGKQYPFNSSFTISESLSVSETSTNLRGLVSTTSESLSVSETISALKGISFTVAESLGLIEVKAYVQKKWSNVAKSTVATITNGVKTAVSVITNTPKS